jgi:hypothetical protein
MMENITSGCELSEQDCECPDAHAKALCRVAGLFRFLQMNPLEAGNGGLDKETKNERRAFG